MSLKHRRISVGGMLVNPGWVAHSRTSSLWVLGQV